MQQKNIKRCCVVGNYSQLTRNPRRTTSKNMRSRVYNRSSNNNCNCNCSGSSSSNNNSNSNLMRSHSRRPLTPTWQRFDGQLTDSWQEAASSTATEMGDNYGATTMPGTCEALGNCTMPPCPMSTVPCPISVACDQQLGHYEWGTVATKPL